MVPIVRIRGKRRCRTTTGCSRLPERPQTFSNESRCCSCRRRGMPIKKSIPVMRLHANPAIAQGTKRTKGRSGNCLKNPSMRRSSNPNVAKSSASPRKWRVSRIGHVPPQREGRSTIRCVVANIADPAAATNDGVSCSGRISRWRISPPVFPVSARVAAATTEKNKTAGKIHFAGRESRRNCHSPSHANAPVACMNRNAMSAVPWCASTIPGNVRFRLRSTKPPRARSCKPELRRERRSRKSQG